MVNFKRGKFTLFAIALQVIFIVIFGLLGDYDPTAQPKIAKTGHSILNVYPQFQDVHVMIFIGFGFLMTFLKRYGYAAVSINLLIASFVIQWAIIVRGLIHGHVTDGAKFTVGVNEMLTGDFAAATVLISFGAVLGKTSPLQLLVMALIEVVLSQINEWIGLDKLKAEDVGESMYIHAFGAYFGLAVARVLFSDNIKDSNKEGAVYHSDIFSMIGTVFLWIYWPSFNGGAVSGDQQQRAVVNTYLSLVACTIVTFAISAAVDKKGKFEMVHIQNATLAGGVAVGTTAHMPLGLWGALTVGSVAGLLSTIGFRFITPFLNDKFKIHDTCGVNNLHGMPGLLAGIAGACTAALATYDKWGDTMFEIFPGIAPSFNSTDYIKYHTNTSIWEPGLGRSEAEQGGYQMVALLVTVAIAIFGGAITGVILRIPIWDNPRGQELFDDQTFFNLAEDSEERSEEAEGHLM